MNNKKLRELIDEILGNMGLLDIDSKAINSDEIKEFLSIKYGKMLKGDVGKGYFVEINDDDDFDLEQTDKESFDEVNSDIEKADCKQKKTMSKETFYEICYNDFKLKQIEMLLNDTVNMTDEMFQKKLKYMQQDYKGTVGMLRDAISRTATLLFLKEISENIQGS